MIDHFELANYLDNLLQVKEIKDFCPNGLQIQGRKTVQKVVTGVTASQALINKAIEQNADAIIVHHGYFWKNESYAITGMKYQRIASLIKNDINLYAYHLPLDVNSAFGNNVELGRLLQCDNLSPLPGVFPQGVVYTGELSEPLVLSTLADELGTSLHRAPLVEGNPNAPIKSIAWCTGGGQGFIEQAAEAGVDLFITGEVSEQTIHIAREMGINFIAAGHHATERYGIKSLGEHIEKSLQLDVRFIDIPNPA